MKCNCGGSITLLLEREEMFNGSSIELTLSEMLPDSEVPRLVAFLTAVSLEDLVRIPLGLYIGCRGCDSFHIYNIHVVPVTNASAYARASQLYQEMYSIAMRVYDS